MNRKKIVLLTATVFCILFYFVYKINMKYPDPTIVTANGKASLEHNHLQFTVEESDFYTAKEVDRLWPDEPYEDYCGYHIKMTVKNTGDIKKKLDFSDFELVSSNAFTQGVDMQVFMTINEKDIKEKFDLDCGESVTCVFPFLIVKNNFTDSQWHALHKEEFGLVLALYPVKKELLL